MTSPGDPYMSATAGAKTGAAGPHTYTCYAAEDECSHADHVTAVLTALADWPDRRADGAAWPPGNKLTLPDLFTADAWARRRAEAIVRDRWEGATRA